MAKVFISYSRKDTEFAKKLTGELQKSDYDFWIDWEGIPPTVDWWREIEKGIEEADIFLFIISPDSATSKICGQEIDTAVKNGKRIIPVVTREIEWEDTPPQLGHLNYIFFSREDDFDTATKKLLTAIQTDYEWAATHRRFQVKALEWERSEKENSFLLRGKDLQDAEEQLATNTSKEPHPTDLQREYIHKSRQVADRQRRITTGISIVGIIALAALAVYGFIQAGLATANATEAENQAAAAQTAQANAEVAQASAEAESRRAISGQLALESKSVLDQYPQRAQLLALEALMVNVNAGEATSPIAEEAMRAANAQVNGIGLPGFAKEVSYLHFTSDNQWLLAASGFSGEFHAWNIPAMKILGYTPIELKVNIENELEYPMLQLTADEQWLLLGSNSSGELYAMNLDEMSKPGYTPLVLHDKSNPENNKYFNIYFANGDEWLVITEEKYLDENYNILEKSETQIYPISTLKPDVEPIVFNNPIIISDKDNIILELQEEKTLLWRYVSEDLDDLQSFVLDGKYVDFTPDPKTILTNSPTRGLLAWNTTLAAPKSKSFTEGVGWQEFGVISDYFYGLKKNGERTTGIGVIWNIKTGEHVGHVTESEAGFNHFDIDHESWIAALDGSSKILYWDLSKDDFTSPIIIEDVDYASEDDLRFFNDPFGNWFGVQQYTSAAIIYDLYNLKDLSRPPISFDLQFHDELLNYTRFSPKGNWLQVDEGLGWNDGTSYLIDLRNNFPLNPKLKETGDPFDGFLLDGWYVIAKEDTDDNDIWHTTFKFIDLSEDDFEPDLVHISDISSPFHPYWEYNTDESGNWLNYRSKFWFNTIDPGIKINTDILISESRLVFSESILSNPVSSENELDNNTADFEQDATAIDTDTGNSIRRIGFEDEVVLSATSEDKRWYAEGSYGGSLRLWDLEEERKYELGQDSVGQDIFGQEIWILNLSSDGKWLTSGNKLWHLENGLPSGIPRKFSRVEVYNSVFSPDAKWLLSYDENGIMLTNLDQFGKNPLSGFIPIDISQIDPYYLVFSPDSRWLIAFGEYSNEPGLWDLANPTPLPILSLPEKGLANVIFTPDEKYIIGHTSRTTYVSFSLGVETYSSDLFVWKFSNSEYPEIKEVGKLNFEQLSQISPNGYWLLTQENSLWDIRCIIEETPCEPFSLDIHEGSDYEIITTEFSSDSRYLVNQSKSLDADYKVNEVWNRIWRLEKASGANQTAPNLIHNAPSNFGWDRSYWDIIQPLTGRLELGGGGGGGGGGGIGTYKVDYGIEFLKPDDTAADFLSYVLRGHEEEVNDQLISPSGKYAITISSDSIKLWDLEAVQADPFTPPVNLPIDTSKKLNFKFTMDDRWLVFLMDDYRLEFHPLRVDDLMTQACRSVGRNFIINEWQRYFLSADYRKTCENLPEHPSVLLEE